MKRRKSRSLIAIDQREKGYIAQPIPTPIRRKRSNDQMMYFTRSFVPRRLKNPNAIEMSSANSVIAWKWLR